MTTILPALVAACFITWLAVRAQRERQMIEREAFARERALYERLAQARKDGYEIPEPATPVLEPVIDPLEPALEALVLDWEGPAAQQAQRDVIRRMRAAGKSPAEIVRALTPAEFTA